MRIIKYKEDNTYCVYQGFFISRVRAMVKLYDGEDYCIAFIYRPYNCLFKDFDKNNYIKGLVKRHFKHLKNLSISVVETGVFDKNGERINAKGYFGKE